MLTDKQIKMDKQMELHQFQKRIGYDGDLSPCQVCIQLNKEFSS